MIKKQINVIGTNRYQYYKNGEDVTNGFLWGENEYQYLLWVDNTDKAIPDDNDLIWIDKQYCEIVNNS